MAEINMKKVVGETFEDMSISEMVMVQGSGEIEERFATSPACVYFSIAASKASSAKCAGAVSAIASAVSGAVVSIAKC